MSLDFGQNFMTNYSKKKEQIDVGLCEIGLVINRLGHGALVAHTTFIENV